MKLTPNLAAPMRVIYFAFGVILIALPFVFAWGAWSRWLLPSIGALAIAEGVAGW